MIALSIDFHLKNTINEIKSSMNYLSTLIGDKLIYYTIEYKHTGQPHIHGITDIKKSLIESKLKNYFTNNWNVKETFSDNDWLNYMTKERKHIHCTHTNEILMILNERQNTRPPKQAEGKTISIQSR